MFNRTSLHIAMLLWGCIFSLIAALCMLMSRNFDREKRKWLLWILLCCACLLLNDAFAWGFRGVPGTMAYFVVRISNGIVFLLSDGMVFLYHGYLCYSLFGKRSHPVRKGKRLRTEKDIPLIRLHAVYMISVVGMMLVLISQFTHLYYYIDADNIYHRNPGHVISMVLPMICMILDVTILIPYRKKVSRLIYISLLSYIVLPFIMTVIQTFYYGISLTNIAISISMILMFVVAMMEQNENLARKENEAAQLRISIMLSQIAPHFIYNTISSIQQLCRKDLVLAEETLGEFAMYLRGNLDSLSETEPIPFEREFQHVQSYLAIEKKRFGKRVNVEYQIEEEDFVIPALALQPLVENAVKHGLCKKDGGGTLRIATERKDDTVYVTVQDDGVGFDMEQMSTADAVHVGLSNVASRVESMCGGSLRIESKEGKGTIVMITLPQKGR